VILDLIWFVLVAVLVAGYAVLDGFDLGVGFLHLLVPRSEEERRLSLASVAPVWDGNEVWLLTAGGALFAAFPPVYATVFSGFYLAMMLVLLGLIVRAVSIAARNQGARPAWRRFFDRSFAAGSTLVALLLGVAVGNLMRGLPLDARGEYAGTFWDLLNPFSLFIGATTLAMFAMQGACWLAMKTQGDLGSVRSPRPYSPGPRSWPCTWMPRCGRLQTHPGSFCVRASPSPLDSGTAHARVRGQPGLFSCVADDCAWRFSARPSPSPASCHSGHRGLSHLRSLHQRRKTQPDCFHRRLVSADPDDHADHRSRRDALRARLHGVHLRFGVGRSGPSPKSTRDAVLDVPKAKRAAVTRIKPRKMPTRHRPATRPLPTTPVFGLARVSLPRSRAPIG